jgi:hypothetical protein
MRHTHVSHPLQLGTSLRRYLHFACGIVGFVHADLPSAARF